MLQADDDLVPARTGVRTVLQLDRDRTGDGLGLVDERDLRAGQTTVMVMVVVTVVVVVVVVVVVCVGVSGAGWDWGWAAGIQIWSGQVRVSNHSREMVAMVATGEEGEAGGKCGEVWGGVGRCGAGRGAHMVGRLVQRNLNDLGPGPTADPKVLRHGITPPNARPRSDVRCRCRKRPMQRGTPASTGSNDSTLLCHKHHTDAAQRAAKQHVTAATLTGRTSSPQYKSPVIRCTARDAGSRRRKSKSSCIPVCSQITPP